MEMTIMYAKYLIINCLLYAPSDVSDTALELVKKVSERCSVGVRSSYVVREESGTAVALCSEGHFMTSSDVCPEGARDVRIYHKNGRMAAAQTLKVFLKLGVSIIGCDRERLLNKSAAPVTEIIAAAELADFELKIGEITYVAGNSNNCLINDLQISVSKGYISGIYYLKRLFLSSTYMGKVYETTSASDWHLRGAPVLDKNGRLIGIVTVNFNPARFLTCVIPAAGLKEIFDFHRNLHDPGTSDKSISEGSGGLGFTVIEQDGAVVIEKVSEGSQAQLAGLDKGQKLLRIGSRHIKTKDDFVKAAENLKSGIISITVEVGGSAYECRLEIR